MSAETRDATAVFHMDDDRRAGVTITERLTRSPDGFTGRETLSVEWQWNGSAVTEDQLCELLGPDAGHVRRTLLDLAEYVPC